MNFEFSRWDEFIYGKVCQGSRRTLDRKQLSQSSIQVKKAIQVGLVFTTLAFCPASSQGRVATSSLRGTLISRPPKGKEISRRMLEARKLLSMSQEETATFLNLSLRSLQSLEKGEIELPTNTLLEKYKLYIEISNYLKSALNNRKFAISAAIRTPLSVFGGKSAVEYGKSTEDGGEYVLATLHRMYG